jgi:endonuclease III
MHTRVPRETSSMCAFTIRAPYMTRHTSSHIDRTQRIRALNTALTRLFPDVHIALTYTQPHELLFAVILSAQCTDERVNKVTKTLFKTYKTIDDFADAPLVDLERAVFQTGFYKNKAKSIKASAMRLRDVYGGVVPNAMEELLTLRGVARKTANVVLAELYGIVEGVVVDTHVRRFVARYDLCDSTTPEGIEKELMALLPQSEWRNFPHRVIYYGRQIAPARKYDTSADPLVAIYPPAGKRFRV